MTPDTAVASSEASTRPVVWEPESPFVSDAVAPPAGATAAATASSRAFAPAYENESPFAAESADSSPHGAQAEQLASLIAELHDPEFNEALEDLVNEAAAIAEDRPGFEVSDPVRQRLEAEQAVRDYLQPLQEATEGMLDRLEAGLANKDLSQLSEAEVDALLEQLAPAEQGLSPVFENFLGGVLKKAKNAIKKVGKFLPHNLILGKLKKLARPLLERVLRFATAKLPVALRPIATQLAKRFLRMEEPGRAEAGEEPGEAAAADPAAIQNELDTRLAGELIGGETFEREAAVEEVLAEQNAAATGDPLRALEQARDQFAREVVSLQDGEDPRPAVENFIPAVLAALRLGIQVIGRPRVVGFLSGYVSKLIAKYVGPQQATTLSRALVDTGLKLVSLESPQGAPLAAGQALAATVEDTVNRLVQTAPEAAWQSEQLLESYVREAFEGAASAHFPDALIRPELHETAQAKGVWVALPDGTARKRYKKYSLVSEVEITPQTAKAIKTFRGISLQQALTDKLGIPVGRTVRARLHLYEAIAGTTPAMISFHEKNVPGLGSALRSAWSLFHPLTPEVAGMLLSEPGLGRPVEGTFTARRRLAIGQRLFYLEIPGARVRVTPRGPQRGSRAARSAETRIVVDFPKRQLRMTLYYAETQAQELATLLRKRPPASVLISALKAAHEDGLGRILSGVPTPALRLIHEAAPVEHFSSPRIGNALRVVGGPLARLLRQGMLDVMKREIETRLDRFVAEFEAAARSEADGVTLCIGFNAAPLLEPLRKAFAPGAALALPAMLASLGRKALSEYRLEIRPGFVQ